jgi:hypothetical protein
LKQTVRVCKTCDVSLDVGLVGRERVAAIADQHLQGPKLLLQIGSSAVYLAHEKVTGLHARQLEAQLASLRFATITLAPDPNQ